MNYLLKELIPPLLGTLKNYSFEYGWKGNFQTYEEAKSKCKGYDQEHILKRIISTTKLVKNGTIPYERDGIPYDKIKINSNLLSVLLLIASRNNNKLTVIDFGGSLGTSYYQNLPYLRHMKQLSWCIVEQANFVEAGRDLFANESLRFYRSMEECMHENSEPDLILISNSLQYIDNPYGILKEIQSFDIPYLLLDYVGYNDKPEDRVTIQYVPPVFYGIEASYPCTFFNKVKIQSQLEKDYSLVSEFISDPDTYYVQLKPFKYEGSFWELKKTGDIGGGT